MNFSSANMSDLIVSSLDLVNKPEVYNRLVGRYPQQRDLDWLKDMGKLIPVAATTYYHHEENEIIPAQLIASVANGSGSNVVVTLDSSVHSNSGVNSYPRVGDVIQFKDLSTGLIISKDESTPNAHTITVTPLNASQNVQSGAVAGDTFIMVTSAFEEGTSGYTKTIIPTTNKVTNQLQIFGEFFSVTTSEEEAQTWFEFENPTTGQMEARYYIKGEVDTADRFAMKENLGMFITPQSDSNLKDASNNLIRTTNALIPTLTASANILDYTSSPSMTTYDTLIKLINKSYGVPEYLMMEGLNFSIANKNFHVDFAKNGAVQYNTFGGGENGQKRAAEIGFTSISYCGYTFHIKRANILSHAGTTGATGFPYSDYFICIPMGAGKDPKTTEMVDYFGIRYRKMPGAGSKGHYKVWEWGGGSKNGTNGQLVRNVSFASEKGLQVFGAIRYVLGRKK